MSDVAAEVGVTRQTVYRYYPRLSDLLNAVAESGAVAFIGRMQAHVATCVEPIDAVVESIVFCLDELPGEQRIAILLDSDEDLFGSGITSLAGVSLAADFLRELSVDWRAGGIDDDDLEGLAELMLRLIGSLMQHPTAAPRSAADVRSYLLR